MTTAVKTTLTVTENLASGAAKDIRTVDASASTGAVTYDGTVTNGTAGAVATIKGGSGDDTLPIVTATLKDDASTTADETVSASVQGGAGKDGITINTSGTGTTTVSGGDGNDTVTLTTKGTGKLTVDLGAGDDAFKGAGAVAGNLAGGRGQLGSSVWPLLSHGLTTKPTTWTSPVKAMSGCACFFARELAKFRFKAKI